MTLTGTVFNVQGYSIHDGPGIRTVVFLKGCPMRCRWCSNPESQDGRPELEFFADKCARCGRCVDACTHGAIARELPLETGRRIDRSRCDACGACARHCPAGALRVTGAEMTVREVVDRVRKDSAYYRKSGGGVTLSGGEPLVQPAFAGAVLRTCYEANIQTAVETAGHVAWERFAGLLPFTDLVLYDLKHMDDARHRQMTGVSNRLILDNARRLAQGGTPMVVRIPLIPGFNDAEANLAATAAFVSGLGLREIQLLPFHQFGRDKYRRLGRAYEMADRQAPGRSDDGRERLLAARATLSRYGLDIQIGG